MKKEQKVEKVERLNMDFGAHEEIAILREFKSLAIKQGKKIREFVLEVMEREINREKGQKK